MRFYMHDLMSKFSSLKNVLGIYSYYNVYFRNFPFQNALFLEVDTERWFSNHFRLARGMHTILGSEHFRTIFRNLTLTIFHFCNLCYTRVATFWKIKENLGSQGIRLGHGKVRESQEILTYSQGNFLIIFLILPSI